MARTRSDLLGAFRLLYESYLRAGLAAENAKRLRVTPYHLLPGTEVFVAKLRGEVIATMTMVADSDRGLPMESMYGNEVQRLRDHDLRLAEMGSFADRRESPARFLKVFNQIARLVVQVAEDRGINGLVAATHPRHARFYKRSLGFRQFGELKSCPYAEGNPAVALLQEFAAIRETTIGDRLFGDRCNREDLIPTHWDPATKTHLRSLVEQNDGGSPSNSPRPVVARD